MPSSSNLKSANASGAFLLINAVVTKGLAKAPEMSQNYTGKLTARDGTGQVELCRQDRNGLS